MKEKKSFFLWVLLFIFLTTYNFDSIENAKSSFLPVRTVTIEGAINSDKEKIQRKLNNFKGNNIVFVSRSKLREIKDDLIFVKELRIKKVYPDKIKVIIIEHKPIGIFINKNQNFLLTESGKIIKNYQSKDFKYLPLINGPGAEKKFHIFYRSLKNMNFQNNLISQYNYFHINRWDIILKDDKIVKLPIMNYENSLEKFLSIYKEKNFSAFKVFDFRVKGQLILK